MQCQEKEGNKTLATVPQQLKFNKYHYLLYEENRIKKLIQITNELLRVDSKNPFNWHLYYKVFLFFHRILFLLLTTQEFDLHPCPSDSLLSSVSVNSIFNTRTEGRNFLPFSSHPTTAAQVKCSGEKRNFTQLQYAWKTPMKLCREKVEHCSQSRQVWPSDSSTDLLFNHVFCCFITNSLCKLKAFFDCPLLFFLSTSSKLLAYLSLECLQKMHFYSAAIKLNGKL